MDATTPLEATSLPVRSLRVDVVEGPDAGATATGESIVVGTAADADLRLTDATVSRYHAELRTDGNGILIIDHGSTNGTWAGAVRIERGHVSGGMVLHLGGSSLRLADAGSASAVLHRGDVLGELRGRSALMRRLMAQIDRAAASDVSVLVTGESGTGKELVARALHALGSRAAGPLVTVDCGALAPTLVASELFGHEKGAFTGATERRIGAFEQGSGGTVFLDEIGELPAAVQAALLGVLERRRLRRLGGRDDIGVDVRVIAATHRDLRAEVNRGNFRLDLFYRLAVVTLRTPALRERPDDIPMLVEHFARDAGWERPVSELVSPPAMAQLQRHHFAGNVRELRNLVESAIAMGEPPSLDDVPGAEAVPADVTLPVDLHSAYKDARAQLLEQFEARYVEALLARTDGNVSAAARLARMTRSHLNDLISKHRGAAR